MLEIKKEIYEIRLIIWESRDVALVGGGKVSIKLKLHLILLVGLKI